MMITSAVAGIKRKTMTAQAALPNPARIFHGDSWEKANIIPNGHLSDIQYTGDILKDFQQFLFRQGGGLSDSLKDPICWTMRYGKYVYDDNGNHIINWNAFAPKPHKDGKRYHTSNDITWILYSSPSIYKAMGYTPTSEDFYNMTDERHTDIAMYHYNYSACTESVPVNIVLAYSFWGSGPGGLNSLKSAFVKCFGDINAVLAAKGEYFVFEALLEVRQAMMKKRNPSSWPANGRGWSNGLAQFHRVFKHYTKN